MKNDLPGRGSSRHSDEDITESDLMRDFELLARRSAEIECSMQMKKRGRGILLPYADRVP